MTLIRTTPWVWVESWPCRLPCCCAFCGAVNITPTPPPSWRTLSPRRPVSSPDLLNTTLRNSWLSSLMDYMRFVHETHSSTHFMSLKFCDWSLLRIFFVIFQGHTPKFVYGHGFCPHGCSLQHQVLCCLWSIVAHRDHFFSHRGQYMYCP